jgi:hypothetical protein
MRPRPEFPLQHARHAAAAIALLHSILPAEEERIRRKVHAAEQMLIDAATQQQSMLLACRANSQHTDLGLRNLVGLELMLWSNILYKSVLKKLLFTMQICSVFKLFGKFFDSEKSRINTLLC